MPENTTTLPMCEFFNPLFGCRCEKNREGDKACHSQNPKCPDYKPTEYKRVHQLAS